MSAHPKQRNHSAKCSAEELNMGVVNWILSMGRPASCLANDASSAERCRSIIVGVAFWTPEFKVEQRLLIAANLAKKLGTAHDLALHNQMEMICEKPKTNEKHEGNLSIIVRRTRGAFVNSQQHTFRRDQAAFNTTTAAIKGIIFKISREGYDSIQ